MTAAIDVREARRTQRELRRVELAGQRDAARVMRRFVRRQAGALRRGSRRIAFGDIRNELVDILADSMVAASVIGVGRAARERAQTFELAESRGLVDKIGAVGKLKIAKTKNIVDLRREYKKFAKKLGTKAVKKVGDAMFDAATESVKQGLHLKKAVANIRKAAKNAGVATPSGYLLNTLFRTHTQIAAHGAHWVQSSEASTMWGYMYVTADDERVRPGHAALHEVVLPKEDELWKKIAPPNGWNCRCYLIPLFDAEPVVRPRRGWEVDKGFDVNWGKILVS